MQTNENFANQYANVRGPSQIRTKNSVGYHGNKMNGLKNPMLPKVLTGIFFTCRF